MSATHVSLPPWRRNSLVGVLAACLAVFLGCGRAGPGPTGTKEEDSEQLVERTSKDGITETVRLAKALQTLKNGDPVGAEAQLRAAVQQAEADFGRDSLACLDALQDLASLHLAMSQPQKATAILEEAVALGNLAQSREFDKAQISAGSNLGEIYHLLGNLDKAQACLKENLAARERFYGKRHSGYAYGLMPYAAVLLRNGQAETALTLSREAVRILRENEHPRLWEGVELCLEAALAVDPHFEQFAELEQVTPEGVRMIVDCAIVRVRNSLGDPGTVLKALSFVAQKLRDRSDVERIVVAKTYWACAALAHGVEAREERIRLLKSLVEILDECDAQGKAVVALLTLAYTQNDLGQNEEALKTYQQCVRRAKALGNESLTAHAYRNLALHLSALERGQEAEDAFRRAIEAAGKGNDAEQLARARAAFGIFVQHAGRLEEAKGLLQAALQTLPPNHLDAICSKSHLEAIVKKGSCGCGDTGGVYASAMRAYVLERLPGDMVQDVQFVKGEGEEQHWQIKAKRQLTEEEAQTLNHSLRYLQRQFYEQVQSAGQPSFDEF